MSMLCAGSKMYGQTNARMLRKFFHGSTVAAAAVEVLENIRVDSKLFTHKGGELNNKHMQTVE